MEAALLVLYIGKSGQKFCIYYGGWVEADRELGIMKANDPGLKEVGRLEVFIEESYRVLVKGDSK